MNEKLIELVYEGLLEDEPWLSFLQLLRRELGGVACSLNWRLPSLADEGFDVSVSDCDIPALRKHYAEDHHPENPFPYADLQPGKAYRWSDFTDAEVFHQSVFYRQFCQPVGYKFALCLCIETPWGGRAWLHAVRDEAAENFDVKDLLRCEFLTPHLQRALRLFYKARQLENERKMFASAIDELQIGTVLLDCDGCILSSNQHAQLIIRNNSVLSMNQRRLYLKSPSLQARFQSAFASMLTAGHSSISEAFAVPRTGIPPLGMLLKIFPGFFSTAAEPRPAMILYLTDPAIHQPPAGQLLQSLFGLTGSEARLTALLADGLTLTEAAGAMCISQGSARVYSKRVFAKMGVNRQADLVRTVLKSVVPLARTDDGGTRISKKIPSTSN